MGFFSRRTERNSEKPLKVSRFSLRTLRASERSSSATTSSRSSVATSIRASASLDHAHAVVPSDAAKVEVARAPRRLSPNQCRFVVGAHKLGKGAYGVVLHGTDMLTAESVAIKLIRDGRMKPSSLDREVTILRRLSDTNHPALVRFHAHLKPAEVGSGHLEANSRLPLDGPLPKYHALVMEMCEGGELFEHVVRADGLHESASAPICAQICDALRTAHALGIVHRDLKLENVLVCGTPGSMNAATVRLIDWGLAHQHTMGVNGVPIPETLYSRCGSKSYMAPEVNQHDQCKHVGYDGFMSDVWSLGVCLFAIHHAFFPFEQANPHEDWRARKIASAQARGESTVATIYSFYPRKKYDLSPGLVSLLDRMLVFDPSKRASLEEVASSEWMAPHLATLMPDLRRLSLSNQMPASTLLSLPSSAVSPLAPPRLDARLAPPSAVTSAILDTRRGSVSTESAASSSESSVPPARPVSAACLDYAVAGGRAKRVLLPNLEKAVAAADVLRRKSPQPHAQPHLVRLNSAKVPQAAYFL